MEPVCLSTAILMLVLVTGSVAESPIAAGFPVVVVVGDAIVDVLVSVNDMVE